MGRPLLKHLLLHKTKLPADVPSNLLGRNWITCPQPTLMPRGCDQTAGRAHCHINIHGQWGPLHLKLWGFCYQGIGETAVGREHAVSVCKPPLTSQLVSPAPGQEAWVGSLQPLLPGPGEGHSTVAHMTQHLSNRLLTPQPQ